MARRLPPRDVGLATGPQLYVLNRAGKLKLVEDEELEPVLNGQANAAINAAWGGRRPRSRSMHVRAPYAHLAFAAGLSPCADYESARPTRYQAPSGAPAAPAWPHEEEGRELHLFEADGTELEYVGEFRYRGHYEADAPEVNEGPLRKVIVLDLEKVSGSDQGPRRTRLDRLGSEPVKEVPVEQALTESMLIEGNREPYEAERREQRLARALADYLEREGHEICRFQFRPEGEPAPLFCDLVDKTTNTLYESKGTVTRPAMRMAIGQLADYSRLLSPSPNRVILCQRDLEGTSSSWQAVRTIGSYADDGIFAE